MRWGFLASLLLSTLINAQRVDTDFEGAAVRQSAVQTDGNTIRFAPIESEDRVHWYFRIAGLAPQQTLNLVASVTSNLPARASVSYDAGETWELTPPGKIAEGTITYVLQSRHTNLLFASQPPLTLSMVENFMEQLTKNNRGIETSRIGTALSSVPMLRFCEGDRVEARRIGIIVQAGYHTGESGSSWASIGLAQWLSSASPDAVWLRQNAEVLIIPISNTSDRGGSADSLKEAVSKLTQSIMAEERRLLLIQLSQADPASQTIVVSSPQSPPDSKLLKSLNKSLSAMTTVQDSFSTASSSGQIQVPLYQENGGINKLQEIGAAIAESVARTLQH
jgi:hypothetical protein